MKTALKRCFSLMFVAVVLCPAVYAHPGGTDANGGHYNRSTGEYHYHHGYSAHQHAGGVCPYNFDDKTGQSSGANGAAQSSDKKGLSITSANAVVSYPASAAKTTKSGMDRLYELAEKSEKDALERLREEVEKAKSGATKKGKTLHDRAFWMIVAAVILWPFTVGIPLYAALHLWQAIVNLTKKLFSRKDPPPLP